MLLPVFAGPDDLKARIDAYFDCLEEKFTPDDLTKVSKNKPGMRITQEGHEPESPTISGLALFLGFNSRQKFEEYQESGEFAQVLKRGRLRIEAAYEKKLHRQPASGAIFALKTMGWSEKTEGKINSPETVQTLKIEIIETGPQLAASEKDVIL